MDDMLVLGRGFLGEAFERMGFTVSEMRICAPYLTGTQMNLMRKYKYIINTIGYSDTRGCEEDIERAFLSNARVPHMLDIFCMAEGIKLIHISTGCVYEGLNQTELDAPAPRCNYSLTKLLGEKFLSPKTLIFRPRLLFGQFTHKRNLLTRIRGFDRFLPDFNSMTCVEDLVAACSVLRDHEGVYNISCVGNMSPVEVAMACGLDVDIIESEELRKREGIHLVNNTMDISKLLEVFQPSRIVEEIMRCNAYLHFLD